MRPLIHNTLATVLLVSSAGCSLGLPERVSCESQMQCLDAFGQGATCQADGYCTGALEDSDAVGTLVDGVSATTIRTIGVAAQTGPAGSVGVQLTAGIRAAFAGTTPEERGGYELQHYAIDDGYVPETSASITQRIVANEDERSDPSPDGGADAVVGREAFAVLGSVGSPTSAAMLDVLNTAQVPFFGTFSGAPHLYNSPPDRVVWQFRPKYEDESYRLTQYLVSVRDPGRIEPTNVFVFSQSAVSGADCSACESETEGSAGRAAEAAEEDQTIMDEFGFAGYTGVRRALQEYGVSQVDIPLATYRANSTDVAVSVRYFSLWLAGLAEGAHPPQLDAEGNLAVGIVMIPVGPTGADFVARVLDEVEALRGGQRPGVLSDEEWEMVSPEWKAHFEDLEVVFTSISPSADSLAGALSTNNAARLCGSFPVIISQIVPFPLGNSSAALRYRDELEAFDPSLTPSFASFEGWATGKIWAEVIRRAAENGDVTSDGVIDVLESDFRSIELGVGTTIDFSQDDHLGSDKIFATRLDETCAHQDFSIEAGG